MLYGRDLRPAWMLKSELDINVIKCVPRSISFTIAAHPYLCDVLTRHHFPVHKSGYTNRTPIRVHPQGWTVNHLACTA